MKNSIRDTIDAANRYKNDRRHLRPSEISAMSSRDVCPGICAMCDAETGTSGPEDDRYVGDTGPLCVDCCREMVAAP